MGKNIYGHGVEYEKPCEQRLCDRQIEKERTEQIKEMGQLDLKENAYGYRIYLLNIIGEIEGHQALGPLVKTTKYEHVLPELARVEEDDSIDGLLDY